MNDKINKKYNFHKCYVQFGTGEYKYPKAFDCCCTDCAIKFRSEYGNLSIISPRSFPTMYGSRISEGYIDRFLTQEELYEIEVNNRGPKWATSPIDIEYDKNGNAFIHTFEPNEVKYGGDLKCTNCSSIFSPKPDVENIPDEFI